MVVIKVPKTPKKAYNPNRRASDLLKQQVAHLEWAVRPAGKRKPRTIERIKPVRTEAEAAARTEELLRRLPSAQQLPLPPPELAPPTTRKRKRRSRRKMTSKTTKPKKTRKTKKRNKKKMTSKRKRAR